MNKYRLKGWYLLLNIIVALATLASLTAATIVLLFIFVLIIFSPSEGQTENVLPLAGFGGLSTLCLGLMALLGIALPLGNALFSYLQVGSTNLELRIWPFYRLRYDWNQVIGIKHVKILGGRLSLPMLQLTESQTESRPLKQRWASDAPTIHMSGNDNLFWLPALLIAYLVWSVKSRNRIPVYLFKGWPNGRLRQDLESRLGPISFQ